MGSEPKWAMANKRNKQKIAEWICYHQNNEEEEERNEGKNEGISLVFIKKADTKIDGILCMSD